MAIVSDLTHQLMELYRKVFPIPCLLCGLPSQQWALCHACVSELPILGPACIRCAKPVKDAQICGQCLKAAPAQIRSFCLYRYQGSVRRCITAFKYQQQLQLANLFAEQMALALSSRQDLPDCLIPIPLHQKRLRQRGYNQAAEVAKILASRLNITYRPELLKRVKSTQPQSTLTFQQRKNNMRQAFALESRELPSHIALVDDVMTSGYTCGEAANLLKRQGVKTIEVWTIARAIRHH